MLYTEEMSSNEEIRDYKSISQDKLNNLSRLFLSYHVDCLRKQQEMNLSDNQIPCNMLFNEHFKYFREVSELQNKPAKTKK
jgi:hypothetical protein